MTRPPDSSRRAGLFPARPVRWGLPDAVAALLLAAVLTLGNYLLVRAGILPRTDTVGVVIQVAFYLIIAAFIVVVSRTRGLRDLRRDFGLELHWIDLVIGVGLAIAIQIANLLVYQFAITVLHLPPAPTGNVSLPKSRGLAVFDGLAIASFLAPIVEELFFRGLVMRAVRNFAIRRARFEGPLAVRRAGRISIIVSALIFAAAHLYESTNLTMLFVLGVWVFIFGLISAAVATRTGRLGPSVIAHMLTNGFAAVLLLSATH